MNGRSCRRKGHDFERLIARKLRPVFPGYDVRRGFQSRSGGEAPDVDVPCFWVECKREIKTNPKAALAQAVRDSEGKGNMPVAICKDDGGPITVTMLFEDFVEVLATWYGTVMK